MRLRAAGALLALTGCAVACSATGFRTPTHGSAFDPIAGVLRASGRCLILDTGHGTTVPVVWPRGYRPSASAGELLAPDGQVVATVGQRIFGVGTGGKAPAGYRCGDGRAYAFYFHGRVQVQGAQSSRAAS